MVTWEEIAAWLSKNVTPDPRVEAVLAVVQRLLRVE